MTPAELIAAKEALGMTQKQLADALGITTRHLRNYEQGGAAIPKQTSLAVRYLLVLRHGTGSALSGRV